MKWNELPMMMVKCSKGDEWRGPYHVVESSVPYFHCYEVSGSYWGTAEFAKPYTAPTRRPMTRDEVLAWACSADALGWVVRHTDGCLFCPQSVYYNGDVTNYTRSRSSSTGDYKWEPFEVEVTDGQH